MLTPHTLTPAEVSAVHNARCSVHAAIHLCESIGLTGALRTHLDAALRDLNKGIDRAVAEDDALTDSRLNEAKRVGRMMGLRSSIWSMPEVADFTVVPFAGARRVIYQGRIASLPAPATWANLWRAADDVMHASGDRHHVYIEAMRLLDDGATVEVHTGS